MPADLPTGDPAPADGTLPASASAGVGDRRFGVYLHVPFCAARCGYCDFNTYTAAGLGGASPAGYVDAVVAELGLARRVFDDRVPTAATVFVGGGTPTLLEAGQLARLLGAVREAFGLDAGVEVTTEANPESVTPESLARLRAAGFSRISFGMQSAMAHVLTALDRTHTPGRVADAVGWARRAGFDDVSLDLIYGAAGESLNDWRVSVEAALELAPTHVSAYALIVEEGTRLATRIARGEVAASDDDEQAAKYVLADELLTAAGFDWYEVSNWARDGRTCRHNLGYWRSDDWWGVGAGAHSHVGGVRWWNVKHPAAYTERLASGRSPAAAREVLDDATRRTEDVMLRIRLAEGLPLLALPLSVRAIAGELASEGLLEPAPLLDPPTADGGRLVLTRQGRLLADLVTRRLLPG